MCYDIFDPPAKIMLVRFHNHAKTHPGVLSISYPELVSILCSSPTMLPHVLSYRHLISHNAAPTISLYALAADGRSAFRFAQLRDLNCSP